MNVRIWIVVMDGCAMLCWKDAPPHLGQCHGHTILGEEFHGGYLIGRHWLQLPIPN